MKAERQHERRCLDPLATDMELAHVHKHSVRRLPHDSCGMRHCSDITCALVRSGSCNCVAGPYAMLCMLNERMPQASRRVLQWLHGPRFEIGNCTELHVACLNRRAGGYLVLGDDSDWALVVT